MSQSQYDQLNEIAKGIRQLNKNLCCNGGTGGGGGGTFNGIITNPCSSPVNTKMCEFPQLMTELEEIENAIKSLTITAENIILEADQIDLSTNELELLITQSNVLLNSLLNQAQRGINCATPDYVNVCNQIDLSPLQTLLNAILTQVSAVNTNTDTLENLASTANSYLTNLPPINTTLGNIKTDTTSLVTNTGVANSRLLSIDTSLNNIETYTQVVANLKQTFQPTDCDLNPVGPTVDVLPTIVKNRVDMQLCNVQALANAIALAITFPTNSTYDTVTQFEVTTAPVTVAANTVHSISYAVLTGTCSISIGGFASVYSAGETSIEEASGLINVPYIFTPSAGARVRVKTIKV